LTKTYWFIPEPIWNETIKNKIIDMIVNILGYAIGTIIGKIVRKK
jgi:glycopeptide antibiotics resistance protein